MGKLWSIIVFSIMLILVFLFFGSLFESCTDSTAQIVEDTTEMVSENIESAGEEIVAIAESDEQEFEDNTATEETSSEDTFEVSGGSTFEMSEEEKEEVEESRPVKKETPAPKSSSSSGGSNGNYMIIAGSYTERYNADKMVAKLEKLGFDNARVVHFDNSNLHAAVAGYYANNSSAKEAKNSLASKGVDCYVKRKS